jgi:hypothetical protein
VVEFRGEKYDLPAEADFIAGIGDNFDALLFGKLAMPPLDEDGEKVFVHLFALYVANEERQQAWGCRKEMIRQARAEMERDGYPDTFLGKVLKYVKENREMLKEHWHPVLAHKIAK